MRMIIELAGTLGLEVVAEGIESADQLDVLREMGCDLGQGFHLSPPLSTATIEERDPRRTTVQGSSRRCRAGSIADLRAAGRRANPL